MYHGEMRQLWQVGLVVALMGLARVGWAAEPTVPARGSSLLGAITGTVSLVTGAAAPDAIVVAADSPSYGFVGRPVPRIVIKPDGAGVQIEPALVVVPVGQSFEVQNLGDKPQLVVFRGVAQTFHSYLLPGMAERWEMEHTGALTLQILLDREYTAHIIGVSGPYLVTTGAGPYQIRSVPPGDYYVWAWGPGLQRVGKTLSLASGNTETADFQLDRP
jgi:hypothetical protein